MIPLLSDQLHGLAKKVTGTGDPLRSLFLFDHLRKNDDECCKNIFIVCRSHFRLPSARVSATASVGQARRLRQWRRRAYVRAYVLLGVSSLDLPGRRFAVGPALCRAPA